jgi:hypothetical protein
MVASAHRVNRGRARVDPPSHRLAMLAEIIQHVANRIPHGTRRRQIAREETIAPQLSAAKHQPIYGSRHAHREPLHPARQLRRTVGLDNQVKMVGLHGEVQNPKISPRAGCRGERATHGGENKLTAQRAHERPQHHMHRMRLRMPLAHAMRHVAPTTRSLAPRSNTTTAPSPRRRQLKLHGHPQTTTRPSTLCTTASHHESHYSQSLARIERFSHSHESQSRHPVIRSLIAID